MFLPMIIALISIILPSYFSLAATIDNTKPRRDIHGQLMDIHDGNVIKVRDLYHWQVKHFFYRQVTEICIRQRHTPGNKFLFRNGDAHQNGQCTVNTFGSKLGIFGKMGFFSKKIHSFSQKCQKLKLFIFHIFIFIFVHFLTLL